MRTLGALREPRGYSVIDSRTPMSKWDRTMASSSAVKVSRWPVRGAWPVPETPACEPPGPACEAACAAPCAGAVAGGVGVAEGSDWRIGISERLTNDRKRPRLARAGRAATDYNSAPNAVKAAGGYNGRGV